MRNRVYFYIDDILILIGRFTASARRPDDLRLADKNKLTPPLAINIDFQPATIMDSVSERRARASEISAAAGISSWRVMPYAHENNTNA